MPEAVKKFDKGLGITKWDLSRSEEQKYFAEVILREMESGLLAVNGEGRIIEFNRAAQEITGYRKEEVMGRFYRDLWGVDPLASSQEREILGKGTRISVRSKISPVTDRKGKLLGWVEIFQDLSQVRERMALAEVGEAAAQVAHEIRSPLGGIMGFTSLLRREAKEMSQERLISCIVDGIADIDRLVNDLLDFTRPQPQPKEVIDLNQLTEKALMALAQEIELGGIEVKKKLKRGGIKMEGDSLKLRQAIVNLLLNGVQAMPQGGRLGIRTFQRGEKAVISVSDTGCGIPSQIRGKIFKPFFSRREGGTGLGLALVKKIVTAHRGEVALRSKPGRGTTISLLFPLWGEQR